MALENLKIPKHIDQVLSTSPKTTNFHEQAQFDLAKMGLKYIVILTFLLSLMFFILLVFGVTNADLFKEVLIAYITFASGAIGGIFGYYFRVHEERN